MSIPGLIARTRPGRKIQGIAAALLAYDGKERIDVRSFQHHLQATQQAGLMNAVNMDTGYVNYLSDDEMRQVLGWAREALGAGVPFVAGAYIEERKGDLVSLYRRQMEAIVKLGGIPILFQTSRLQGKPAKEKVAVYRKVCQGYAEVLGFELGSMFAPNGEIFDDETVRGLLEIVGSRE
jgi:hypothetical protein